MKLFNSTVIDITCTETANYLAIDKNEHFDFFSFDKNKLSNQIAKNPIKSTKHADENKIRIMIDNEELTEISKTSDLDRELD